MAKLLMKIINQLREQMFITSGIPSEFQGALPTQILPVTERDYFR